MSTRTAFVLGAFSAALVLVGLAAGAAAYAAAAWEDVIGR